MKHGTGADNSKGFTLLELLIAVSLSVILMTVLVVGLNSITRDWEKLGYKLDEKIDESLLFLQLEKAILGTFAYQYKESNTAKKQILFRGSMDELLWVSTVSPNQSSGLSFWHLKINHQNAGIQLKILPVYPGKPDKQLEEQTNSSVYFTDYDVSLHYLSESTAGKKQWLKTWVSKGEEKLPLGIRIDFKTKNESLTADNNIRQFSIFGFIRASALGGELNSGSQGATLSAGGKTLLDIFQSGEKTDTSGSTLQGLFK
ncbi:MAG: prepilin-type N-terminal cleavage/methylation domain-containing protein [gamma proteobacterium symbiont of Taylorina sp.]|nr:prepilin-type N-terminal cleavage/methylation domain-containing protein [gamma proteobacterium symbiont of Taylorina sp.]